MEELVLSIGEKPYHKGSFVDSDKTTKFANIFFHKFIAKMVAVVSVVGKSEY